MKRKRKEMWVVFLVRHMGARRCWLLHVWRQGVLVEDYSTFSDTSLLAKTCSGSLIRVPCWEGGETP